MRGSLGVPRLSSTVESVLVSDGKKVGRWMPERRQGGRCRYKAITHASISSCRESSKSSSKFRGSEGRKGKTIQSHYHLNGCGWKAGPTAWCGAGWDWRGDGELLPTHGRIILAPF